MSPIKFTVDETRALETLCELELGAKEHDRIASWRAIDTAQDKLLASLTEHRMLKNAHELLSRAAHFLGDDETKRLDTLDALTRSLDD